MPQRPPARVHSEIPVAASEWRMETLGLLNAKFDSQSVTDFTFSGLVLPDELKQCITDSILPLNVVIDHVAEAIANVNNSDPLTVYSNDNEFLKNPFVIHFATVYYMFCYLLRRDSSSTSQIYNSRPV